MIGLRMTVRGRIFQGHRCRYEYDLGRFCTEAEMVARVRELRSDPVALLCAAPDFLTVTSASFEAREITGRREGRTDVTIERRWPVLAGRRRVRA